MNSVDLKLKVIQFLSVGIYLSIFIFDNNYICILMKKLKEPGKPSLALRAAAFQQHMALKMFNDVDPAIKKKLSQTKSSPKITKPKPKKNPLPSQPVPTSTIFESNSVEPNHFKYRQKLDLAEKIGLVEAPPPPLSDEQFETVKIDAQKRGFFNQSCPICLEPFGPDNLVLLSCSHLLHATCLMNFRKFAREHFSDQRCPVCRSHYEFVEVHAEGAYNTRCATSIQRVFRGFLIRSHMNEFAPKGSLLSRRWVMAKVTNASDRLVNAIDRQSDAVDAMLSAIDADLEYSRQVMKAAEMQGQTIDWENVRKSAISRGIGECPVCLRLMKQEDSSVTSCGHVFHTHCLQSWLSFCSGSDKPPTCPVCRGLFQWKTLIDQPFSNCEHCEHCEEDEIENSKSSKSNLKKKKSKIKERPPWGGKYTNHS